MPVRRICSYCGKPVNASGYCTSCRLHQDFLRKTENTSLYHYNIGLERAKNHDLSGAIEALLMSLRYNKTNIYARNLLGLIYYEMGETVPAMSHWVISANHEARDNPAVRYLKELRDNPETLERSDELAKTFNLALMQAKNREFDLAVIQLHKCIAGNDHYVKAYLLLSLISLEQKKKSLAEKYLSKVLSIDKNNPMAIHYLQEMGESVERAAKVKNTDDAKDSEEETDSSDELYSYYGMEEGGGRPARRIAAPDRKKQRVRVSGSREQGQIRHSNLYMLAGLIIGAMVFYFLIAPDIRKSFTEKINELERTYTSTLSSRNTEIENLNSELKSASDKSSRLEGREAELEKTIEGLEEEVTALKAAVEAGGGTVVFETSTEDSSDDGNTEVIDRSGVGHNPNGMDNAAAERNNANVRGISTSDIENLIQSE